MRYINEAVNVGHMVAFAMISDRIVAQLGWDQLGFLLVDIGSAYIALRDGKVSVPEALALILIIGAQACQMGLN